MKHFCIEVDESEKLSKDTYIKYYKQDHCQYTLSDIEYNYDKNIDYFSRLSATEFQNELTKFLKKYKDFKEIFNLNECEDVGFYLMVLDEYKQVYIGVSDNIKKRIIQHWNKHPNCLLFRNKEISKLCIDSFKALDTTRIFVWLDQSIKHKKDSFDRFLHEIHPEEKPLKNHLLFLEDKEAKMIPYFNNKYTCNRYTRENMKEFVRDFDEI